MDFSRIKYMEWIGFASAVLLVASLFMPWFGLTDVPERAIQGSWICGENEFTCSAWESYSIYRWVLVAAASAPLFLFWFVATDEMGKYPTGEFTMTVGFAVIVLVGFNGAVLVPGEGVQFGVSLLGGYFLALVAGVMMAAAGALRSLESGGGGRRKPPATY